MSVTLRPATPLDADVIARLAVAETEGLMTSFWGAMSASHETPEDVGVRRIKNDHGIFSWKNATVAECEGEIAGVMISEITPAEPEPISEDMHPMVRPVVRLQNDALETRFIYFIATLDAYRGQSIGEKLVAFAEEHAGPNGVVAIATEGNAAGQEFLESCGYERTAEAPLISTNWDTKSNSWYLLGKPKS